MQVDSANQPAAAETASTEKVQKLHLCTMHCILCLQTTSSSGTKSEGQSTQQSGKAAGTPQGTIIACSIMILSCLMCVGDGPAESAPIRAPASLWRCSRIMHLLRDLHPTLLSALEGIVDRVSHISPYSRSYLLPTHIQLIWFRESWYEDLLRQLNEGLALCYQVSFKNRTDGKRLAHNIGC